MIVLRTLCGCEARVPGTRDRYGRFFVRPLCPDINILRETTKMLDSVPAKYRTFEFEDRLRNGDDLYIERWED
jgi:hypothetical protein